MDEEEEEEGIGIAGAIIHRHPSALPPQKKNLHSLGIVCLQAKEAGDECL